MLSSIHPLGERARRNRWGVTIAAFGLGTALAGAGTGALLAWAGSALALPPDLAVLLVGGAALAAGGLDLLGPAPPGPRRQVNERWIGRFRGWVYGTGFGAQLGVGSATFVVTWGVWAWYLAALASGAPAAGAAVGAAFGLGRALLPLSTAWVDRPSRLTRHSLRMASLAPAARLGAGVVLAGGGLVVLLGGG